MSNSFTEFESQPAPGSLITKLTAAFGGQIGVFVFGFASQVILAQSLGASGKGTYSLILLIVVLIFQFINGSLGAANSHFTGRYSKFGPGIIGNSLIIALVLGSLITWTFISHADRILPLVYPEVDTSLVKLTILSITALLLLEYCNCIVRGQDRIARLSFTLAIREFLFVAVLLVLLLSDSLTVDKALTSWVAIVTVVALFATWSAWSGMKFKLKLDFSLWISMVKYSLQAHAANLTSFLRMRIDMLILAAYLDIKTVGYYSITFAIIQFLFYLPRSVAQVLGPHISWRENSAGDILTPILCRVTFFITVIVGLLLIVLGYPGIRIIFGEEFLPAYLPLVIMVPGAVLFTLATSLSGDLGGRGKPHYAMKISTIMLVLNVIINLSLIPLYGMIGAAFAASITQAITGILFLKAFIKESKASVYKTIVIQREDFIILRKFIMTKIK